MPAVNTDPRAIKLFLERGIENFYPSDTAVEKALGSGKRLKVYLGIDPTGPALHLGHAIPLRKLADLQKLGHEAILLIGDFTAMIGDPTDKTAARKKLTREEVLSNCRNYKKQASKFLSFTGPNAAKFAFNSKWLAKMTFADVVELASHFTVQQLAERDMFEKRMKESKPVYLHEFLYPLMQGYDSVAMDVDMEIGGNDQTFNMLAGRTLMKEMKGREKFVLTTALLEDASGRKMGKTEGNMITFDDSPEDMYGKVMSWTDGMIIPGFRLCTDVTVSEIDRIEDLIKKGGNPVEYKHRLAGEVVALFHSPKAASAASAHFLKVHKSREVPDDIPGLRAEKGMTLVDALAASGLVSSKTEARRQIRQGGVKVDGKAVKDIDAKVKKGSTVQKGKRHFVRIV
jgi:tyrosyl-tRNA synthetase